MRLIRFIRSLLFGHGVLDMTTCSTCGGNMRLLKCRERDVPILGGLIIMTRGERWYACEACNEEAKH